MAMTRGAGRRRSPREDEWPGQNAACGSASLRAEGDPGRLSESLPPDRHLKDIDFALKVLWGSTCQCLAVSLSYSVFSVRKF